MALGGAEGAALGNVCVTCSLNVRTQYAQTPATCHVKSKFLCTSPQNCKFSSGDLKFITKGGPLKLFVGLALNQTKYMSQNYNSKAPDGTNEEATEQRKQNNNFYELQNVFKLSSVCFGENT